MEEPRIYLFAHFDKQTNQRLAELYDRLAQAGFTGEQTQEIPYHFTLSSLDVGETTRIMSHAQDVALRHKAFNINLNHIGLFGLRVLFLAPSVNLELLGLHRALMGEGAGSGCHDWVPHATLLIDQAAHIEAALPIAAQWFVPFCARIEGIGVYLSSPKKMLADYPLIL